MQSQLVVKNFGPIDEVDLHLRNVNVFIGPQASGKSALAKVYTIFKAPRRFLKNNAPDSTNVIQQISDQAFKKILEEYNIGAFLKPNTEIAFYSELHDISYSKGIIHYDPKMIKWIDELELLGGDFDENINEIKRSIIRLSEKFISFSMKINKLFPDKGKKGSFLFRVFADDEMLTYEKFQQVIVVIKEVEELLSTNTALYIPAERNFVNIIRASSMNLLLHDVPIPKHILSFGAELEKSKIDKIDLGFLHPDMVYRNINGEDRIFTDDNNSIKLSEAASGIQSALPVIIPILSQRGSITHRSFVIEEPELNLFPLAQYELVKYLEKGRVEPYWEDFGTIHTYTTHSPYILSALNNLLYADKVSDALEDKEINGVKLSRDEIKSTVGKILPVSINKYYFTAYQISNGKAEDIFDRENGLIRDNYIDQTSDKMTEDFEALMDLLA